MNETDTMPKLNGTTDLTQAKAYLVWLGASAYYDNRTDGPDEVSKLLAYNMGIVRELMKARYDNVFDVDRVIKEVIYKVADVRRVMDSVSTVGDGNIISYDEDAVNDFFNEVGGLKTKK